MWSRLAIRWEIGLTSALLGRVLDGLGRPIDGLGRIDDAVPAEVTGTPPNALRRRRVTEALGHGCARDRRLAHLR